MKKYHSHYIKNLLLPCLVFSVFTGVFSTLFITFLKSATEQVVSISECIYSIVRNNPIWLPCLLLSIAIVGLISSYILSFSHACRGGGIPSSIAAIRGITNFNWLASLLVLPFAALLTFLCGLPLGTEGPCVQMGTAVGDGTIRLLGGKKHIGWRRYIMTGGAAAGFSLATGAPITAIIFSAEELHKCFSPLLFSVASISVLVSQMTSQLLAMFGIGSVGLFHIFHLEALPLRLLFAPLVIGLTCGCCSVLFTRLYHKFDKLMHVTLGRISTKIKFPLIFACVALIGFFLPKVLGTGHSLVEHIFETSTIWYMLVIIFLLRAIFMMIANTAGVTGGIFLPTLAFGAILGAICANIFIAMGVVSENHYLLFVVLGMTAFLGANSRIPITASVFAIEALGGIYNILAVIIAVTASFLFVEISGLNDFTDTIVEKKAHAIHSGKEPQVIEVPLTIHKNSFAVDKELQDILWPVSCVVLSIEKMDPDTSKTGIHEGDVLTVHYKTYNPIATAEEFEVLVGKQSKEIERIMRPV